MSLIRQDDRGIYVQTGGYRFRPGDKNGYSHAYTMDDAGLQPGDRVKARHIGGSIIAKITLADGGVRHWSEENS